MAEIVTERPGDALGSEEQAAAARLEVTLLTGGGDKPYALGLSSALLGQGVRLDFIGSDALDVSELRNRPEVNFLNLRGAKRQDASLVGKTTRVLRYYARLISYAATAKPKIFHILWNNKFELIDRTLLLLYYRLLGKRIVFTAHNVNAGKRDGNDSFLNRLSLRLQYFLVNHIFVHTRRMKSELVADFGVAEEKVTIIPFGINDTLPNTKLTSAEAKEALGVGAGHKTLLFFGRIAPYKGLDYLIAALGCLTKRDGSYRLLIAGIIKDCLPYWRDIQQAIDREGVRDKIIESIEFIPDEKVELYFKAADVLVLPYTDIFQSGVLFLAYSFGLPAIVTDVGSMKEEIIAGKTGFACRAQDPDDLARAVMTYFASDLFENLEPQRQAIQSYANERYSWDKVGGITKRVYSQLAQNGKATRRAGAVRK